MGQDKFTVFLDRDGVFNHHPKTVVKHWRDFYFLPDVPEAFALLNRPDVQTCLCTNQPTVGMGLMRPATLAKLHARMVAELEQAGGRLDHIEAAFAPAPVPSRRRKPGPGLLEAGARALGGVDKNRAIMIGDKPKDAGAAAAFGIPAILLSTTYTAERLQDAIDKQDLPVMAICTGLPEAVDLILERL